MNIKEIMKEVKVINLQEWIKKKQEQADRRLVWQSILNRGKKDK